MSPSQAAARNDLMPLDSIADDEDTAVRRAKSQ